MKVGNGKILVIGGAGFIGSNLVRYLLKMKTSRIVVIDNLLSSEEESLPRDKRINFIRGSIENDNVLIKVKDEYSFIFHLATFHGNQNSIFNPLLDHKHNTLTTLKLFNHIKNFKKLKKVVYTSAGCAVAEKGKIRNVHAVKETDPVTLDMDSPYSISKIIGEFYSMYFYNHYGLPVVRVRFQNVYGPWEILGAGRWRGTYATVWRNVVPVFIYKALQKESLPVENRGVSSRDFIYVEDVVRALVICALHGRNGDVYNIATGKETKIIELARTINELTGNSTPITFLPRRNWDNSIRRFGDPSKIKKELGFSTRVGLKEGLERTIRWTKRNMDLIEKNIFKHKRYIARLTR